MSCHDVSFHPILSGIVPCWFSRSGCRPNGTLARGGESGADRGPRGGLGAAPAFGAGRFMDGVGLEKASQSHHG